MNALIGRVVGGYSLQTRSGSSCGGDNRASNGIREVASLQPDSGRDGGSVNSRCVPLIAGVRCSQQVRAVGSRYMLFVAGTCY